MFKANKKIFVSLFSLELLLNAVSLIFYFDSSSLEGKIHFVDFVFPTYLLFNSIGFLFVFVLLTSVDRAKKLLGYGIYGSRDRTLQSKKIVFYYSLLRLAFFAFLFAVSLPFSGDSKFDSSRNNVEIIFCLDLSKSMDVQDMGTSSRMENAKRILTDVINNLKGEKIGLCVFAGNSSRQIESTRDYNYFRTILKNLNTDLMTEQGTNIWDALLTAEEMFTTSKSAKGIVVFTDAENHNAVSVDILEEIEKNNIGTVFIGLGSKQGGKIPMEETGGFLKDENGVEVISKMNPDLIDSLARSTKGSAVFIENEFPEVTSILTEINLFKAKKSGNLNVVGHRLLHHWFLFAGLLFFSASLFFSIFEKR